MSRSALSDDSRAALDRAVLVWLATADAEGRPNVSPKEVFLPAPSGEILIAEIASAGSLRNIRANPEVCVSALDVFRQKGMTFHGTARIIAPEAPDFAEAAAPLARKAGPAFAIRHVIAVSVTRARPLLAPGYRVFPDKTEGQMIAEAHRLYGVRPGGERP
ncbi:pyridoxamine 5'-phosphate oxidase family protein [Roseivivax sp. GX 12232]|uniref:pyridoxamine 5'-phosphate oxidase family protein n=1 Tax=Roseivivax sp. GX 12232 TaxID=2900547 RepID=UPI001E3CD6DC|nr:pyridoxamine 5'-phosphate oxidase family protein [Roseivivax sp. GX 12232]MCE0505136.1 pyridoxamine 5'-phosphate oxidase family protein [Roseivivax sp. GX 12232]